MKCTAVVCACSKMFGSLNIFFNCHVNGEESNEKCSWWRHLAITNDLVCFPPNTSLAGNYTIVIFLGSEVNSFICCDLFTLNECLSLAMFQTQWEGKCLCFFHYGTVLRFLGCPESLKSCFFLENCRIFLLQKFHCSFIHWNLGLWDLSE